ncbi:GNAT family N-acetyltransferase [Ornithinibacillus californiensis]|uniref:GNAT family N-acetyltransferase n=1 Tax=Ornithinibacillus californiensis TaxID=161536 RepID=UPI00064DCF6B|nr:GNAT family N-acetyltransferase [Ornithinibacillus californiensis]
MFTTKRCTIRSFEEKDIDHIMTYRNNEEWMKYQSFKNLTKEEYREALLVPIDLYNGIQLAIADYTNDNLLGDLFIKKQEDEIYIGYTINPTYARKGYITEVLESLLPKLNECFSSCRVIAMTESENTPSKNLLLKLGFVYEQFIEEWQTEMYVYPKFQQS